MNWQDVITHPSLQDLPFKIEMNERGQIVMSPGSNRHSRLQKKIGALLQDFLGGEAFAECSVDTPKGVKVADVAWASAAFVARYGYTTPYPKAPELCVEIRSPSNTDDEMDEKVMRYLARGAREVWICDLEGRVTMHDHEGVLEASRLAPGFPATV